ncbi:hypothetical protein, partial [Enterococcus faecalis]|uniref:hypothetical protein n=1 Tax=Enterococcus faecalis TaxID=1351 RepID=UPI003D6BE8A9
GGNHIEKGVYTTKNNKRGAKYQKPASGLAISSGESTTVSVGRAAHSFDVAFGPPDFASNFLSRY